MRRRRQGQESGFALLFVMAMAAIVAIMLYMEMPGVAFEGQRTQEAVLIDHGEQYRRAIKMFVYRFNRYPASLDELEKTNDIRFLRHRYKDPMTGKDEWRLIHVMSGVFMDSLTKKPPAPAAGSGMTAAADLTSNASSIADSSSTDSGDGQPAGPARWQIRRPSQLPSGAVGSPSDSGDQSGDAQQQNGAILLPGQPGYVAGYLPTDSGGQSGQANAPGGQRPPADSGAGQQVVYPPVLLPGMRSADLVGGGSNSSGDTSQQAAAAPPQGGSSGVPTGATFGSGIAGVASKSTAQSIKIYKKHSKYNEWEFIYDPQDEIVPLGTQLPGAPTGLLGGTAPGAPAAPSPTQPTQSSPSY